MISRLLHGLRPNRSDDAEHLVTQLYRGLLGREPDPGGLRTHVQALRSGIAIADVARGMTDSEEFHKKQGHLRVEPPRLPNLAERHPQRYLRNADGTTTFVAERDEDFDWMEQAILGHRYYDSFGVWSPTIDIDKRVTAAFVAGLGTRRCLELGCFTGPVLSLLDEQGIDVTGVEISHLAFVLAYPSIRHKLCYGDLLSVDLQPPYDAMLAMDILEHLNPLRLDRYLARIDALLARDGYCLINSPMFGPDDVFGETAGVYLPEWRAAGSDDFWRHLHCDERGWPQHGHLIWAAPSWWERRFREHGLVRDRDIERRVHACLERFFRDCAPARRSFFLLRREDNRNASADVGAEVVRALTAVLASEPALAS